MNSFELNKILGAVLGTLLFVMGVGFLAEAIYHPIEGRGAGYALPEPEVAEGGAPAEAAPEVALGTLLVSASAERGAAAVRSCESCHSFGEGEPAKAGPNLYNIVGAPKAHMEGFAYSDILLQQREEGQTWTYENLNAFLTNPREYAPGTKMTFSGVRAPEQRADILAYLQTLSASPVAFPEPEAAPAETADAAATDAAATDAPAEAAESPLVALMANASAERGANNSRTCQSCHSFGEGEPAKMGPNLYNIVDGPKAHMEGYAYSDILLQQREEGQTWSFENLDSFLTNPREHAPGTKMVFPGVANSDQRADLMAYLASLSPNPVPLPGQGEAPAETDAPAAAAPEATPDDTTPDALTTPTEGNEETVPTAPAQAVDTPTETQGDTPVTGTPVQETTPTQPLTGNEAAEQEPATAQ